MKGKRLVAIVIALTGISSASLTACSPTKEVTAAKQQLANEAVEAQDFTFEATMVQPSRGISRSLTAGYDLTVSKDTVTAYLPFFGRAYSAPISATDGGIKFTSTSFTYKATPAKRGGYSIRIATNDTKERYELYLSISASGYGTLTVSSNSKETISFSGRLKE